MKTGNLKRRSLLVYKILYTSEQCRTFHLIWQRPVLDDLYFCGHINFTASRSRVLVDDQFLYQNVQSM